MLVLFFSKFCLKSCVVTSTIMGNGHRTVRLANFFILHICPSNFVSMPLAIPIYVVHNYLVAARFLSLINRLHKNAKAANCKQTNKLHSTGVPYEFLTLVCNSKLKSSTSVKLLAIRLMRSSAKSISRPSSRSRSWERSMC